MKAVDFDSLGPILKAWGLGEAEREPRRGDDLQADGTHPERRASAVMLLILNRDPEPTVVLTQRAANLAKHPGQVSFPGGRAEPKDQDLIATALRETQEEVGLSLERQDVLAALPRYATRTGYDVAPFVALIEPPQFWTPQESEVAEIFEAPLALFLERKNWRRDGARFGGAPLRHWWAMDLEGRYLWGATAAMLQGFAEALAKDLDQPF